MSVLVWAHWIAMSRLPLAGSVQRRIALRSVSTAIFTLRAVGSLTLFRYKYFADKPYQIGLFFVNY